MAGDVITEQCCYCVQVICAARNDHSMLVVGLTKFRFCASVIVMLSCQLNVAEFPFLQVLFRGNLARCTRVTNRCSRPSKKRMPNRVCELKSTIVMINMGFVRFRRHPPL